MQALKFAALNPRLFFDAILILALVVAGWLYNRRVAEIEDLRSSVGKLADNLKEQVTIRDNQVEILKRIGGKVIIQKIYMPAEGGTTVQVSSTTGAVTYLFNTKGYTFKPGFGAEWGNRGMQVYFDAKWAYWGRYSALVGGSLHGIGIGVSRHLDDILWTKPKNIEFFLNYRPIRSQQSPPLSIGLRSNF